MFSHAFPHTHRALQRFSAALAALLLGSAGCGDLETSPADGLKGDGTWREISTTGSQWSRFSVDVVVRNEVLGPAETLMAGRVSQQTYHLEEVRSSSGGWSSTLTIPPRSLPFPVGGMTTMPPEKDFARLEIDASWGEPRLFSRTGRPVQPNRTLLQGADLIFATPTLAKRSKQMAPAPTGPRPGLADALVYSAGRAASIRSALERRYGPPQVSSDGMSLFNEGAGDTLRSIVFDPELGAVTSIAVKIAGREVSATSYEYNRLSDGTLFRGGVQTEREFGNVSSGSRPRLRTTVQYQNPRVAP